MVPSSLSRRASSLMALAGMMTLASLAGGDLHGQIDHRQPAAVGGHEGQLALLEGTQDAVEHVARLVGRDGVAGLLEGVLEFALLEREGLGALELRQRRELLLRQPEDLEEALARC